MIEYFEILIAAVAVAWIGSRFASSKLFWLFFVAAFAIVTVPAAIRYGIGGDFIDIYMPTIGQIRNGAITDQELSYHLIVRVLGEVSEEPQLVFVFYSAITYFVAFLAFTRRSFHWAVAAYMMHYYAFTLSGIRQGAALSFLFWCIYFFMRKKWLGSLIAMGLAVFFHRSSALLVLPLALAYWGAGKKGDSKVVIGVFLLAALLWVIDLSSIIIGLVAKTPYAYFLEHPEYINGSAAGSGLGYLIPAAMFFCLFACLHTEQDSTKISGRIGLMCAFSVMIYAVAIHMEIFRRFTMVADTILPFAVARLSRRPRTPKVILGLIFVLSCLIVMFCNEILRDANYKIIPYTTIFDEGAPLW